MEKERERMRDFFEEVIFTPLNRVMGPLIHEESRRHLKKARVEVLKAMRSYIDSEISDLEDKNEPLQDD